MESPRRTRQTDGHWRWLPGHSSRPRTPDGSLHPTFLQRKGHRARAPAHGHRAAGPLWAGTRPWWPPWPSRVLCSLPAVQPPPPKDPQISKTGDHFLLTWSVALGDPQTPWLSQGDLEFEVVYRRLSDSWEVGWGQLCPCRGTPGWPFLQHPSLPQEATSLYSRSSPAVLGAELLVPGSNYVARVRTRLAPSSRFSGRPSRWSPEILWDSQPGTGVHVGGVLLGRVSRALRAQESTRGLAGTCACMSWASGANPCAGRLPGRHGPRGLRVLHSL